MRLVVSLEAMAIAAGKGGAQATDGPARQAAGDDGFAALLTQLLESEPSASSPTTAGPGAAGATFEIPVFAGNSSTASATPTSASAIASSQSPWLAALSAITTPQTATSGTSSAASPSNISAIPPRDLWLVPRSALQNEPQESETRGATTIPAATASTPENIATLPNEDSAAPAASIAQRVSASASAATSSATSSSGATMPQISEPAARPAAFEPQNTSAAIQTGGATTLQRAPIPNGSLKTSWLTTQSAQVSKRPAGLTSNVATTPRTSGRLPQDVLLPAQSANFALPNTASFGSASDTNSAPGNIASLRDTWFGAQSAPLASADSSSPASGTASTSDTAASLESPSFATQPALVSPQEALPANTSPVQSTSAGGVSAQSAPLATQPALASPQNAVPPNTPPVHGTSARSARLATQLGTLAKQGGAAAGATRSTAQSPSGENELPQSDATAAPAAPIGEQTVPSASANGAPNAVIASALLQPVSRATQTQPESTSSDVANAKPSTATAAELPSTAQLATQSAAPQIAASAGQPNNVTANGATAQSRGTPNLVPQNVGRESAIASNSPNGITLAQVVTGQIAQPRVAEPAADNISESAPSAPDVATRAAVAQAATGTQPPASMQPNVLPATKPPAGDSSGPVAPSSDTIAQPTTSTPQDYMAAETSDKVQPSPAVQSETVFSDPAIARAAVSTANPGSQSTRSEKPQTPQHSESLLASAVDAGATAISTILQGLGLQPAAEADADTATASVAGTTSAAPAAANSADASSQNAKPEPAPVTDAAAAAPAAVPPVPAASTGRIPTTESAATIATSVLDTLQSAPQLNATATPVALRLGQAAQHAVHQAAPIDQSQALPVHLDANKANMATASNAGTDSRADQRNSNASAQPQNQPLAGDDTVSPNKADLPIQSVQSQVVQDSSAALSTATASSNNAGAVSAASQAGQPAASTPTATLQVGPTATATPQPNIHALAVSIAAQSQSGTKQFDIHMDPAELGRVDVRLTVDSTGKAQAHLAAEKPQTLELLQRDSGTLARALKESGVQLSNNGLQFSLRGQDRQSGGTQRFASRGRSLSVSAVAAGSGESASLSNVSASSSGVDIRV